MADITNKNFEKEYQKLNQAQKEAVNAIDGPVMVVAGPGTGKTQVLSMRIANILRETDIKADGILCLTFTNSAVDAMKSRLVKYIGEAAEGVNVLTFHSFGMEMVKEYYKVLGLDSAPKLLDDIDALNIFDEVLEKNSWQHIRPRADRSRYFKDLRSLMSLLKRERITAQFFLAEVDQEIDQTKNDPDNISSRGESKGELKKEVLNKIESLERSREAAQFFKLYEETKKIKNVFDYDDVLENLVAIAEKSENAVSDIRERYLYILVDEHQDSSRVQNEFLKLVWGEVDHPDIFVVGDDRQLIYGFSGASIDHFQGFKKTWRSAKLITLVDNYRSTQIILDTSHALLESVMTPEKLRSQSEEHYPIRLIQAESEEDEILACAEDIKDRIKKGVNLNDCAILVPKNVQVRRALRILHECGLAVSSAPALDLFDQKKAQEIMRVFKIISHPEDNASFARSFLDDISGIPAMEAHNYLAGQKMREFSLDNASRESPSLFGDGENVRRWINNLRKWRKHKDDEIAAVIEMIRSSLPKDDAPIVSTKDILDTILSLVNREKERNPRLSLSQFVSFLERLESYGEAVPIMMGNQDGVKVLTLHSSKGLEFDYVWIAHMDERGLDNGKRSAFILPERVDQKINDKDIDREKRKLYVAITRAKRFCALSYSVGKDGDRQVAKVIDELPTEILHKEVRVPAKMGQKKKENFLPEIKKLAGQKYKDRIVSASALSNFFECAWKWYFRNLLGLPETPNDSIIFGDKVHKILDQIIKSGKLVLSGDKEVDELVKVWTEKRLPQITQKRENEQPVSFKDPKFPYLNIFGRIDLIEHLNDGSLRITDFKTGSAKKKSDIIKLSDEGRLSNLARQLAMYSYLIQGTPKWGGAKVTESRLEFLEAKSEKDRILNHSVSDEEINLLMKDIADYDALLRNGGWIDQECHYKSFGHAGGRASKNSECEYCKMAEIYK